MIIVPIDEVLRWPVEKDGYHIVQEFDTYKEHPNVDTSQIKEALRKMREEAGLPPATKKPVLCITAVDSRFRHLKVPDQDGIVPKSEFWMHFSVYDPMKKTPGLFRKFARLPETPEALIDFANRYGLLGIRPNEIEPLWRWYSEIEEMRKYVEMYDACQAPNQETIRILESYVPWIRPNYVPVKPPWRKTRPPDNVDKFYRRGFEGRLVDAVLDKVIDEVNHKLEGQVSPVLARTDLFSSDVTGLAFVPCTLLSAMWLQFAYQVADMRTRRICRNCGKPFWLQRRSDQESPTRSSAKPPTRSDTKYCSPACRTAACRKRRGKTAESAS